MATQNQQQPPPGTEAAMQPKPDYGETSYRGSGKLTGKAALITGADSGTGRAVAIAFAREGAVVFVARLSASRVVSEFVFGSITLLPVNYIDVYPPA